MLPYKVAYPLIKLYNTGADDGSLYYNDIKTLNVINFTVQNASFYNPSLTDSLIFDFGGGMGNTYIKNLSITDLECYRCEQPFIKIYHYGDFVMENSEISNISSTVYTSDPSLRYSAFTCAILVYSIENDESNYGKLYRNITDVTFDQIYSYDNSVMGFNILGSTSHPLSVNIDDIVVQN